MTAMRVWALLLLLGVAAAATPASFVALPPELGSKAPARLVFNAEDLAACWNDNTARRCILRGGCWGRACALAARSRGAACTAACVQRSAVCTHHKRLHGGHGWVLGAAADGACSLTACLQCCFLLLAAPIKIEEDSWRRLFATTEGVAMSAPPLPALTITSGKRGLRFVPPVQCSQCSAVQCPASQPHAGRFDMAHGGLELTAQWLTG